MVRVATEMKGISGYFGSLILGTCRVAGMAISGCAARAGVYDPRTAD